MAGACADAKAALAQNPDDKTAFGIKMLSCDKTPLPKVDPPKPEPPKPPEPPPDDIGAGLDLRHSKGPPKSFNAAGARFGDKMPQSPANEKMRSIMEAKADGNYQRVIDESNEALKLMPDNPAVLNAKSFAQNRLKDYEGASRTADMAIKASTGNATAYANKALALGALGNHKGMIEALQEAAALDLRYQEALEKALASDTVNAFDFPGEIKESNLQGTKAKEKEGLNLDMIKWIVLAAIFIPLTMLVIFFVLKKTILKTPPPMPGTPWPS